MYLGRLFLLPLAALFFVGTQVVLAIEPDFLMDTDPPLQAPQPIRVAVPEAKALWMQALGRPEADMKRMAAETIARAHQLGIPGMEDSVPLLEQNLTANTSHQAVQFASARALIALNSQRSADKLFAISQSGGADLRQLIEPALADWNFAPAKQIWLDRLRSPDTRVRDLVLAIRCLGQVEDQTAITALIDIVQDPIRDASLRLEAATAAGQIASEGLESKAEQFARAAASPTRIDQLIAIRLITGHSSEAARTILIGLANSDVNAVAVAALHRLNEIDSASVAVLAEKLITRDDSQVRLECVASYLKHPTAEHIEALAPLLADAHPRLRRETCDVLWQLAQDDKFNEPIRIAATEVLEGDRWQGQEQAAVLLGFLEHQPTADRFIELLDSPRTEVRITAAWALRMIASPDTIPQLIEKIRQRTEQRHVDPQPGLDEQVAHLFEALGVMHATEAVPVLMQYVPKNALMGVRSRGGAIWALGRIHEDKSDPEVKEALINRITDFEDKPFEIPFIKDMSAIALARMKAVDQARTMRSVAMSSSLPGRLGVALRWAVKELTNEELPALEPTTLREEDWFLSPIHN